MTLLDLKAYLSQHQQATLMDLSYHFQSSPDTVQNLLNYWIKKGKVRHVQLPQFSQCHSGCGQCGQNIDVYQWLNEDKSHQIVTSGE